MMNQKEILIALGEMAHALQLSSAAVERLARAVSSEMNALPALAAPERKIDGIPDGSGVWQRLIQSGLADDIWPRIGGGDFVAPDADAFLSTEYLKRYRPGKPRLAYVAACKGLKYLSYQIGIPQNKVSTTAPERLVKRLRELNSLRYGSFHLDQGKAIESAGFDKWTTYRPPKCTRRSTNSPVHLAGPALRLVMPASLTVRAFDKRFDELVQLGRVAPWLESIEGRTHKDRVGVPPSVYLRRTRRLREGVLENEVAKEVVAFRSVGDFDRLVAIVERVVLEHLELWPSHAAASSLSPKGWTASGFVDKSQPHAAAVSNASGLTPPRWL